LDTLDDFKGLIVTISPVEEIRRTLSNILEKGIDPIGVLNTLNEAMEEVGRRYEKGEYFLSELIMASVLASEATEILKPRLLENHSKPSEKIVIGTVKGDIHDIGKNIVTMMLSAAGLEVVDLGVDVSAERFAEAVAKESPDILAISALLTSTMENIRNVIEVIKERDLRDRVKIIVGGRPLRQEFADELGVDGYAKDAMEAIKIVKKLLGLVEV